ncbi:conserved hypothetical protein [Candidatus Nitrosotenuis uzonensis]|uniref:Uncharacterized protein n=2 Tax=Candidatus Nitrosotenuis uzonensis TaxID=1407055 RepID=V6ATX7_9ARCH|nr:conserved hypothetical protein [Candidatus Nitrosotenuis uzonensis]
MDIKVKGCKNLMAIKGVAVASFIIPIVFSFVYGGFVLSLALSDAGSSDIFSSKPSSSLQFVGVDTEYSISGRITAQVSVSDPTFDCGDLYITLFTVSGSQKNAVTQGAFFDQCYGDEGTLPIGEQFSETLGAAGTYQIEAQLFDKEGDKFLTATQKFTVR